MSSCANQLIYCYVNYQRAVAVPGSIPGSVEIVYFSLDCRDGGPDPLYGSETWSFTLREGCRLGGHLLIT